MRCSEYRLSLISPDPKSLVQAFENVSEVCLGGRELEQGGWWMVVPLQLLQLQGHDHPPAPLLQFPATQPNLTDVLESLHKRLGIWGEQRKPVL